MPMLASLFLAALLLGPQAGLCDGRGAITYTPEAERDRVTELPGWGEVSNFSLFSGYVTVHEARQRRLFYVFAESEGNPADDPVLFWFNGGPGCSSVGGGFLTELGPWYPKKDGKLQANPYSWNKFANVVFVEAPAFVGFSYSRDDADRDVGDKRTASDNLEFLLGFFERFPDFRSNKLWLTGESYAGHYVPELALEVINHNGCVDQLQLQQLQQGVVQQRQQQQQQEIRQQQQQQPTQQQASPEQQHQQQEALPQFALQQQQPNTSWSSSAACTSTSDERHSARLNLEGLTLGNAWTDASLDNQGTVDHWWTHSMISDSTYGGITHYCDFTKSNPLDPHPRHDDPKTDDEMCDYFCNKANDEIGSVDIYDMVADDCRDPRARGEAVALGKWLSRAGMRAGLGVRLAATKGTQAAVERILAKRERSGTDYPDGQLMTSAIGQANDTEADAMAQWTHWIQQTQLPARHREDGSAVGSIHKRLKPRRHAVPQAVPLVRPPGTEGVPEGGSKLDAIQQENNSSRGQQRSLRRAQGYNAGISRVGRRKLVEAAEEEPEDDTDNGDSWYEPCVEDYANAYLNSPEAQQALHANQSSDWVPWRWTSCNHDGHPLKYQEEDLQLSMLPIYDQILALAPDLRILLYSGDADASVPALGTRYWLQELGLRQKGKVDWRTWSSRTTQVGGYLTKYQELTFATVRAAGHMVPYSQPERAQFLLSHFIRGKDLPY